MSRAIDPQPSLARIGDLVRDRVGGDVSDADHARGRARLARSLRSAPVGAARVAQRSRAPVWLVAAALAALAVLVVALWPRARLEYTADGARIAEGGYVAAPEHRPATVRFSDGSAIVLAEGSRGRVADVTPRGARLVLESGRAEVRVVHRPGTAWSVEAGPFVIAVTGTQFDVRWSASDDVLEVNLRAGSVVVRGSSASDGVALRAGQHLIAHPSTGELRIVARDEGDAPTANGASSAPAPASAAPAAPQPAISSPVPSPLPPPADAASWSKRVASGDFRRVLEEADARGLESCMANCSLADLVALGDAARYGGRSALARTALLAQRSRFAGSVEAHTAAFLLGRMADDGQGGAAAAIDWYDRYLAEAPSGSFAAEALGRKMVALRRVSGDAAARPVAADYLRRFPAGPHAAIARELTSAP